MNFQNYWDKRLDEWGKAKDVLLEKPQILNIAYEEAMKAWNEIEKERKLLSEEGMILALSVLQSDIYLDDDGVRARDFLLLKGGK